MNADIGLAPVHLCPLCGYPNACAMAGSNVAGTCWCIAAVFPEDLRVRAAAADGTSACICAACAAAAAASLPAGPYPD